MIKRIRLLAIFNLLAFILYMAVSVLVQLKILSKKDVGEISNLYPSLFTPAGYTFSIWGVIYLALITMCVYHLVLSFKAAEQHEANQSLLKIGGWFMANSLATAAWLLAFTRQQIAVAEILIIFQLVSLIVIHSRLGIHNISGSTQNKIFTQLPFSIYLGWICIATIANTAVLFQQLKWNYWGMSEIFWTCLMIGIASILTLLMIFAKQNVVIGLVFIWALVGILSRLHDFGLPPAPVITFAWAAIGITGAAIIMRLFRSPARHPHFPVSHT